LSQCEGKAVNKIVTTLYKLVFCVRGKLSELSLVCLALEAGASFA